MRKPETGGVVVPIRPFHHALLDELLSTSISLYDTLLHDLVDGVAEAVESDMVTSRTAVPVLAGHIFKAEAAEKPNTGSHMTEGGRQVREVSAVIDPATGEERHPGKLGGKFWIDPKTRNIRYGDRPTFTFHREATPEESAQYMQAKFPPNILFGYSPEMIRKIHKSGHLHMDDVDSLMLFRERIASWWAINANAREGGRQQQQQPGQPPPAPMVQYRTAKGDLRSMTYDHFNALKPPDKEKVIQGIFASWQAPDEQVLHQMFNSLSNYDALQKAGDHEQCQKIDTAWNNMMTTMQTAVTDPQLQEHLFAEEKRREGVRGEIANGLAKSALSFDILTDRAMQGADSEELALTLIAASNDIHENYPMYSRVTSTRASGTQSRDELQARERVKGQVDVNPELQEHLNEVGAGSMTAAQGMAASIASYMNRLGFENASRPESWSAGGQWRGDIIPQGWFHQMNLERGALGKQPLTQGEFAALNANLLNAAYRASSLINANNKNWGADQVGMLLNRKGGMAEKILSGDWRTVAQNIKEREARIAATLAARNDRSWTPGPEWAGEQAPIGYQAEAANAAVAMERGLLAYDTGTGKTIIALAMHHRLCHVEKKIKRTIFEVPSGSMQQWPSEVKRFLPGVDPKKVIVTEGMSAREINDLIGMVNRGEMEAEMIFISSGMIRPKLTGQDLIDAEKSAMTEQERVAVREGVGNHELIRSLAQCEGMFIADEIHQQGLREGNISHHNMNAILNGGKANRKYAYGMSATPVPNEPKNLRDHLELFAPGSTGGDEDKFMSSLGEGYQDENGNMRTEHLKAAQELGAKLSPFMLSLDKNNPKIEADTAEYNKNAEAYNRSLDAINSPEPRRKLLPPKVKWGTKSHTLAASKEEDDLFRAIMAEEIPLPKGYAYKTFEEIRQAHGSRADFMIGGIKAGLLHLATTCPSCIDPEFKGPHTKMNAVAARILHHFSDPNNADHPFVVFSSFPSSFKKMKQVLMQAGWDASQIGEIHGGKSLSDRDNAQRATNEGKLKILLVGTQAGGAGLNLQKAASAMATLDLHLSPAQQVQTYGRVIRTGQENDVEVYVPELISTSDDKLSYDDVVNEKMLGKQMVNLMLQYGGDPETATRLMQTHAKYFTGRSSVYLGKKYIRGKERLTPEQKAMQDRIAANGIDGRIFNTPEYQSHVEGMKDAVDPVARQRALDIIRQHAPNAYKVVTGIYDSQKDNETWGNQRDSARYRARTYSEEARVTMQLRTGAITKTQADAEYKRLESERGYIDKYGKIPKGVDKKKLLKEHAGLKDTGGMKQRVMSTKYVSRLMKGLSKNGKPHEVILSPNISFIPEGHEEEPWIHQMSNRLMANANKIRSTRQLHDEIEDFLHKIGKTKEFAGWKPSAKDISEWTRAVLHGYSRTGGVQIVI